VLVADAEREQGQATADVTKRRDRLADRAYTRDRLADLPAPEPLIESTLDKRTVVVLAGNRGSLKSFVVISWAASIATGQPWLGRKVSGGRSLIVAAEGVHGLHQRFAAWEDKHDQTIGGDRLTVIRGPVNLLARDEVDELTGFIRGGRYSFVALDTIARCMVGGDENSARDMGMVVDSLYTLRDATDAGIVVGAHHTPRADNGRPRGSSALEAGIDTMYVSEGDPNLVQLTRIKRKDGPTDDVLTLRLELRRDSGVVADKTATLSNRADELLSAYMSAFSETGATKAELRNAVDMPPATFHRSLNSLIELGVLRNDGSDKRPFYRRGGSNDDH
jgi:RecA-family ATPase